MEPKILCERANAQFAAAIEDVKQFDDPTYPLSMPTHSLQTSINSLSTIDHLQVKAYRAAKENTQTIFEDHIDSAVKEAKEALSRIDGRVTRIQPSQFEAFPYARERARDHIHEALKSLRLAKMDRFSRFFLGRSRLVSALGLAVGFGVVYFVFSGSGVHAPLSGNGIQQLVERIPQIPAQIVQPATDSDDFVTRLTKMIHEITELFSSVPLLIAAFAGLLEAARRIGWRQMLRS